MAETEEQLRQRHLNLIRLNAKIFSVEALRCYRESGRGAFVVSATPGPPRTIPAEYWTEVEDLPDTEAGLNVFRMIHEYDPAAEFVIVILEPEDNGVHVYRAGLTAWQP